jgi:hypothetical protein
MVEHLDDEGNLVRLSITATARSLMPVRTLYLAIVASTISLAVTGHTLPPRSAMLAMR